MKFGVFNQKALYSTTFLLPFHHPRPSGLKQNDGAKYESRRGGKIRNERILESSKFIPNLLHLVFKQILEVNCDRS